MINKLIKKKHFRRNLAGLRGAKILRDQNDPYHVLNIASDLTKINLKLKNSDFPNILVGSHANIGEILLRQIFLSSFLKLSTIIMQSIGSRKPIKYPLPIPWLKYICNSEHNIPVSFFTCRVLLIAASFKKIFIGLRQFLAFFTKEKNPVDTNFPYIMFLNLNANNLPRPKGHTSYDIISWYNKSSIRKQNIKTICAQVGKQRTPNTDNNLIIHHALFPKLDNFRQYLYFLLKGIQAFIVAIIGVLMGKWWYGYLYNESVKLHYVDSLLNEALAEDYLLHHSNWFYKPLWCYEAEDKGSNVILYFYSTNFENILYNDYKMKEDHGLRIMTWNNFIVWDQEQENFFKRFCPNATFTQTGYLDFSGIEYIVGAKDPVKRLAVFDVTPSRPVCFSRIGFAMAPYYSEELNLKFLEDIIKVFYNDKWEVLWKQKRKVDRTRISEAFNQKQLNLVKNKVTIIDPIVSSRSILLVSDAVISIPFTSTGIIGKVNGVPSVYYDPSGKVKLDKSHDISVLKNKNELSLWKSSLL